MLLTAIFSRLHLKADDETDQAFLACIEDLIEDEKVQSMRQFTQHGGLDCLEHCLYVAYNSFLLCRRLGLDARSAARGGLLHDFFLYDWHVYKDRSSMHAFFHPKRALENALERFELNEIEREIIRKHMWPVTPALPRYAETHVVCAADKYCAFMEFSRLRKRRHIRRIRALLAV